MTRIHIQKFRIVIFFLSLSIIFNTSSGFNSPEEINASVVLRDISNGSSGYNNVIIKGDLNLSQENGFGRIVNSSIVITNSVVEGRLDFRNKIFSQTLDLSGLVVKGDAFFNSSDFSESANFENSFFNGNLSLRKVNFRNYASFMQSHTLGKADFSYSNFMGSNNFGSATFENKSDFILAEFRGLADFQNSTFSKDVDFSKCKFLNEAYFNDCRFYGVSQFLYVNLNDANFFNSSFNKNVIFYESNFTAKSVFEMCRFWNLTVFKRCNFYDQVTFDRSQFDKTVSFNESVFNNTAGFKEVQFDGDTYFNDAQFRGDAHFDGAQINGRLWLDGLILGQLFIRVNDINQIHFNETAYQRLIKNFNQIGFIDDANECYVRFMADYTMQQYQRIFADIRDILADFGNKYNNSASTPARSSSVSTRRSLIVDSLYLLFYSAAWSFYGFGKKPEYTIVWSLIFITLFSVFWSYKNLQKCSRSSRVGALERWQIPFSKRCLKKILSILAISLKFSITVFLAGTRLFIEVPQLPKRISSTWAKRMFWAERALGAIFSLLLFLAISNTVLSAR